MGARLAASFGVLNCQNFGLADPVTVTTNGAGVATAVTYNVNQQKATLSGAAGGTATATPTSGTATATPTSGTATATPTSGTATATATATASPTQRPTNPWARWFGSRSPWSFAPPRRHGHHENGTGM
jgi:hypothetical protein